MGGGEVLVEVSMKQEAHHPTSPVLLSLLNPCSTLKEERSHAKDLEGGKFLFHVWKIIKITGCLSSHPLRC